MTRYVTKGPGPWWGLIDVTKATTDEMEFWMSYRQVIEELIVELRNHSSELIDDAARQKRRQQADVLDFLLTHTEDAIAALDAE